MAYTEALGALIERLARGYHHLTKGTHPHQLIPPTEWAKLPDIQKRMCRDSAVRAIKALAACGMVPVKAESRKRANGTIRALLADDACDASGLAADEEGALAALFEAVITAQWEPVREEAVANG